MKDYYEEIVRELYFNLRPKFIRILTAKYPSIRLDEAEDLYQDAFIAVKENMEKGKVRDNTSWEAYIIQIGINLTNKYLRKAQITDSMDKPQGNGKPNRFAAFLNSSTEDEEGELQSMEVKAILGNELEHSPGRCHKILRLWKLSQHLELIQRLQKMQQLQHLQQEMQLQLLSTYYLQLWL